MPQILAKLIAFRFVFFDFAYNGAMLVKSALRLSEVIDRTLCFLSATERERVYNELVGHMGGGSVYVPCSASLRRLERNISIINKLPPATTHCGKERIREIATTYNLSESCIYRIRRNAEKTYHKIEELYDYGLISEPKHQKYIAVLAQKLPADQIGRVLA